MGGLSKEREISLRSGKGVANALRRLGYDIREIDVGRDLPARLIEERIEIAVVMLHGRWGEDGTIQGLLEVMGIPYSGSSPLASAIAMDKHVTKRLLRAEGVFTPDWILYEGEALHRPKLPFPLPVVVKPNREGSTLGITIVREEAGLGGVFATAARHDTQVLAERFIQGREVTVGLIDGTALPALEIVPKGGCYDFQAKYTKGMTDYIVPARIPEKAAGEFRQISETVFRSLGLSGVARLDFILADRPWFLGGNTIPGMTETSLVPKAAAAAGISYEAICERLVEGAALKVRGE